MPTGGLSSLPDIMSKDIMLKHALTQADKVKVESVVPALKRLNTIQNDRKKTRGKIPRKRFLALAGRVSTSKMKAAYLKKADIMFDCLLNQFVRWQSRFPAISSLHPFERELVNLSLENGLSTYTKTIDRFFTVEKGIKHFRDRARIELGKISFTKGVQAWYNDQVKKLKSFMDTKGLYIDELKQMFKLLYNLNVLTPLLPTAVLIGMPNIGKSSLVRTVSSGSPEVQNYAFTTRSIIVGHLLLEGRAKGRNMIQVTDTPGMLVRPDEERNKKEKLTVAVLNNFPHVTVVFVIDPSENIGAPLDKQFALRLDLKSRFAHHAWIDVVSKCDLPWDREAVLAHYSGAERSGVIVTSAATTEGTELLKLRLQELGENFMEGDHWDALQGQKEYTEEQKLKQEQKVRFDEHAKGQELSNWLAGPPKVRTVDSKGGRLKKKGPMTDTTKSRASRLWTNDLRRPR